MKTKAIVIGLFTAAFAAMGVLIAPFQGWDNLKRYSSDIIIARCGNTPNPFNVKTNGIWIDMQDGMIDSQIQVLSVLKGATNLGAARLTSQYWPRQGEHYLIFAIYHDGFYQAIETYRVVPLGTYRPPDLSTGKTLDEKIHILLQYRFDNLNRQMKEEQEEKQRLEDGLKK
jgi:hypothetical protein